MFKNDIILGSLNKLGVPINDTGYEVNTAFKIASNEFDKVIFNAFQTMKTEYTSKYSKLLRLKDREITDDVTGIIYYGYAIPSDFISLDEVLTYNYKFMNELLYIDSTVTEPSIKYYSVRNINDVSRKYRVYLEYYLASEIAASVNRRSYKQEMQNRAMQEISIIESEYKTNKVIKYYQNFKNSINLY